MRGRPSPVEALVTLPRIADPIERRARWRQAITALGQHARVDGPPPLDGVPLQDLVAAAKVALESGLADDMDWLEASAGAVALYELSAALPGGAERRDLGRRVFERLYNGTAGTFAAVAARMALASGRPLEAATIRARIGLAFGLPIGTAVNADLLAFTLVSRPEQLTRWVKEPATGPLPSRRLAATILERAAREAVRRVQQGDPYPKDLLTGAAVQPAYETLLYDREPLVWRHAAVARGLLAAIDSRLREEIDVLLDPSLSPTEWRRAAVSLVACIVSDPDTATSQCRKLLEGDIAKKDPGIAATLLWGLPPVLEAEPEAAAPLLEALSSTGRQDVADALADLLGQMDNADPCADAADVMRALLISHTNSSDPLVEAILDQTLSRLDRRRNNGDTVHDGLRRALDAYADSGAVAAHEIAMETIARAHSVMDRVEALGAEGDPGLPDLLGPLADLDSSVLERSTLYDLLLLNRRPGDTSPSVPEVERLYDRLGTWVIEREVAHSDVVWTQGRAMARQRKLRALLHLVDLETAARSDADAFGARVRARVRRAIEVLLDRVSEGPDATVHRILCATLARSLDAAAREAVADPSDLALLVIRFLTDNHSIQAIMEASTNPDVRAALTAYIDFLAATNRDTMKSVADVDPAELSRAAHGRGDEMRIARSFFELSRGLGTNGSYRGEALRQVVLRIGRALLAIARARSMSELVEGAAGELDPVAELESGATDLRRLFQRAARRLLDRDPVTGIVVDADVTPLSGLVEQAVAGASLGYDEISMAITELMHDLPGPIALAVASISARVATLPVAPPSDISVIPLQTRRAALPDWLLPRRTIGGFYVVRALGSGGVSSVFVARRIEERTDPNAESYALKVPQYDPSTARSLSEQEFMQLFREEAGALLGLPQHPNLARFVTFDLAARPKPILVMELIRGFGLDRLIRNRSMTVPLAFKYLDGILEGLEAMHAVGVGHLDVKPSNVIMRDEDTPVLVDFGLSGRHLRPGCGTLEYCAPEILGVVPEGHTPWPGAADLYAFACTAFELLTGTLMFDAPDEVTMMSQHLGHDGWPDRLVALSNNPAAGQLCVVLAACLRQDPRARPSAAATRSALAAAGDSLRSARWPLTAGGGAAELTA